MIDMMSGGKNSKYLGSWDLYDLPGKSVTVTLDRYVSDEEVFVNGRKENNSVWYFKENVKPMIFNVTNKKRLAKLFQTKDAEKIIGKRITLVIEKTKSPNGPVDGLRVKEQLPPNSTEAIKCEQCGSVLKPFGSRSINWLADYTKNKYGKILCSDCAGKAAEAEKATEEAKKAEEAQDDFTE